MTTKDYRSWSDCIARARKIAKWIVGGREKVTPPPRLYGIPRGGLVPAVLVMQELRNLNVPFAGMAEDSENATHFIDDIVDSGATQDWYAKHYGKKIPFLALYNKEEFLAQTWVVFPWEVKALNTEEEGPEDNIRRIIQYVGEDQNREGLLETPKRVVKSWDKLYGGYKQDPISVMKVFRDDTCDEMVILKDIEFFSTCEHHLLPFFGKAHIGYIPNGKVIGISKLARLLEVFSRRMQIQERIGQQITNALQKHLNPKGCGCVLEAQHFCMTSRGVEKQNSVMVTSSMVGCFLKGNVKSEFLRMAGH